MATLDEIFYKEFENMMKVRKGATGAIELSAVPLPPEAAGRFFIEKRDKVFLTNIDDEYYGKLNNTECLLWGRSALQRRKFDYKGEYMMKDGRYIYQDVTCPTECTAIISDLAIGVPLKYKPSDKFEYVDMVVKKDAEGNEMRKFVYIIPKKYCFRLNQTALVLSWNRLRVFYSGVALALQNGHILHMYVIPYKPSDQFKNYRILHCKTTDDYSEEIKMLRDFWVKNRIIFNPDMCGLMDFVRGRENMAYLRYDGVLDVYERYNLDRPMGDDDSAEDLLGDMLDGTKV